MSRDRPSSPADARIALVAAGTTWAALTSWSSFLEPASDLLFPAFVLGAAIALSGVGLRALSFPRPLVPLVQVVVAGSLLTSLVVGAWLPIGAAGDDLVAAIETAVRSAQTYAAPVGPDAPPITPLLLAGAAPLFLLVDVLACTVRRVPVAGLPLLAVFSVPAGLTGVSPHWISFVLAAAGFLALLHLDAASRLTRWGRSHGETRPGRAAAVARGAVPIGAGAIAIALVAPLVVPVVDAEIVGFGGDGGSGKIKIRKPRADLRRDLERGEDVPLVRVRTDDPRPSYLRIGVLNRFTGNEWSSGDRDVSSDQTADRDLPEPQGLSPEVPRTTYEYEVEVEEEFDSTWLPTQFPITSISSDGEWRYDEDTYDFLAVDDENAAGSSYRMTALQPDFGTDGRWFGNPASSAVEAEVLEVPGGIPSVARNSALQVTEPATDDYERALLLQSWFRTDGGFRYDLRRAPEGEIGQTLETFLTEGPGGRVGYCEQFAAAMAIMARIVGIPARVAVGFLRPTAVGDGSWEYSSHDLHAWPELYFSGTGWVRFEPTPGDRAQIAPDYSTVPVRTGEDDDPVAGPDQQPSESTRPDQRPSEAAPSAAPEEDGASTGDGSTSPGDLVWRLLVVVATVLALVVAVTGPRLLRARRRSARMAGTAEDLWREVLDTARDLAIAVPAGRSPRETADRLRAHLGGESEDAERPRTGPEAAPLATLALDDLVRVVERQRYGRPVATAAGSTAVLAPAATDLAATVVTALEAGAPRSRRQRATWWPRSLWTR